MNKKVKCLIYCTKDKNNQLYRYYGYKYDLLESKQHTMPQPDFFMNGKIVAQFDCEKVEEIYNEKLSNGVGYDNFFYTEELDSLFKKTQLDNYEIEYYLGSKGKGEKVGYAIYISNLKIFDKPKELNEYDIKPKPFKTFDGWYITNITYSCTKAPQNMCNVYDVQGNHYILISIRPEWVCKILNGEKTIEIRRVVVNQLKKLIGE